MNKNCLFGVPGFHAVTTPTNKSRAQKSDIFLFCDKENSMLPKTGGPSA